MLTYNTQLKDIILPEYGRSIQSMVEYCMTLEDKAERTRCAYSIVNTMGILFPEMVANDPEKHKFWDHLAVMSNYNLDIDWPFDVIHADSLDSKPEPVPMFDQVSNFERQYGRVIEQMALVAADMEDCPDKDAFIELLANQMKKVMSEANEDVDDQRIFDDLAVLSKGKIRLTPDTMVLRTYKVTSNTGKKKKKK